MSTHPYVLVLAANNFIPFVPSAQGGTRTPLGMTRYCAAVPSDTNRERWVPVEIAERLNWAVSDRLYWELQIWLSRQFQI